MLKALSFLFKHGWHAAALQSAKAITTNVAVAVAESATGSHTEKFAGPQDIDKDNKDTNTHTGCQNSRTHVVNVPVPLSGFEKFDSSKVDKGGVKDEDQGGERNHGRGTNVFSVSHHDGRYGEQQKTGTDPRNKGSLVGKIGFGLHAGRLLLCDLYILGAYGTLPATKGVVVTNRSLLFFGSTTGTTRSS